VPAADRNAVPTQKIAQHAGAREGALEMKFVNPPHEAQVFERDGPKAGNRPPPADVQNLRLAGDREYRGPPPVL